MNLSLHDVYGGSRAAYVANKWTGVPRTGKSVKIRDLNADHFFQPTSPHTGLFVQGNAVPACGLYAGNQHIWSNIATNGATTAAAGSAAAINASFSTSADGLTFIARTAPASGAYTSIVNYNEKLFAISGANVSRVVTSTDYGVTWTSLTTTAQSAVHRPVVFKNNIVLVNPGTQAANACLYKMDPATGAQTAITGFPSSTTTSIYAIATNGDSLVVLARQNGNSFGAVYRTTDLTNWTYSTIVFEGATLPTFTPMTLPYEICWDGSNYILAMTTTAANNQNTNYDRLFFLKSADGQVFQNCGICDAVDGYYGNPGPVDSTSGTASKVSFNIPTETLYRNSTMCASNGRIALGLCIRYLLVPSDATAVQVWMPVIIYSDDGGGSWQMSAPSQTGTDTAIYFINLYPYPGGFGGLIGGQGNRLQVRYYMTNPNATQLRKPL